MSQRMTTKYPVVVPGVGPVPAPGMIVGEAPGRNEIEQGIPFCGKSGALLNDALEASGRTRDEFFITNIYKGDVGIGNRNPNPDEIQDHWEILKGELSLCNPKSILLLGSVAAQTFFPEIRGLGSVVGQMGGWAGYATMVLYHPAYVLRGGYSRQLWVSHVGRFVESTNEKPQGSEMCPRCFEIMEWRHGCYQCPYCRYKAGCCDGDTG